MTAEAIEGEVVEVEQPRALVPAQPGQAIVSEGPAGPHDMLEKASHIATALSAMVERQKLYTLISGKKYPHVEAWLTIGRMDNVVAREAHPPILQEDGSYEAEVELIRLSDGLVIGRASALCGSKDDRNGRTDWSTRPAPQKRSMAVTRATSRAFRLQYSWIMALAGYEPTPREEMDAESDEASPERTHADGLIGIVEKGKPPVDLSLRQTPEGMAFGFKLTSGRKGYQVLAIGDLADVLSMTPDLTDHRVEVWGRIEMVPWEKNGKQMPPFARVHLERIKTEDWTLPAPSDDQPEPVPIAEGQEALPL